MNELFDKYSHIREVNIALTTELFKELTRDQLRITARMLDLLKQDKFMLESEQAFDQFSDFAINDYFDEKNQNMVMRYLAKHGDSLDKEEQAVLKAFIAARCSLFEISAARPEKWTLVLRDLLNEGEEVLILDRALSTSLHVTDFLIFARVLRMDDYNMTSGAPILFKNDKKEILLKKYQAKSAKVRMGNENTRLMVAFFKLNRTYGFRQLQYL
jgi:hypothetical protein